MSILFWQFVLLSVGYSLSLRGRFASTSAGPFERFLKWPAPTQRYTFALRHLVLPNPWISRYSEFLWLEVEQSLPHLYRVVCMCVIPESNRAQHNGSASKNTIHFLHKDLSQSRYTLKLVNIWTYEQIFCNKLQIYSMQADLNSQCIFFVAIWFGSRLRTLGASEWQKYFRNQGHCKNGSFSCFDLCSDTDP